MRHHNFFRRDNFKIMSIGIIAASLAACGLFPESTFWLESSCRIPKWFILPVDAARTSVSVKMNTYINSGGLFAEFILYDAKKRELSKILGKVRDLEPISLKDQNNPDPTNFTSYEVVTFNNVIDVVEYVYRAENHAVTFCMVDNPSVLKRLGAAR